MKILIPARGGSERIKDKNLQKINGKTLLEITIEHAQELGEVYVSSDDDRILALAESYGCNTIVRDPEDALSTSPTLPIWKKFARQFDDHTSLMQCTTPIRNVETIQRQLREFLAGEWISGFSGQVWAPFVHRFDGKVHKCFSGARPRTQEWSTKFIVEDGGLYVCKAGHLDDADDLWFGNPYIFHSEIAIDIDNMEDLEIARKYASGF